MNQTTPKRVEWLGKSKEELSGWPEEVKMRFGHHLYLNQSGRPSNCTKPFTGGHGMDDRNNGTFEIHTTFRNVGYRLVFATFKDHISVLAVFNKTTERTPTTTIARIAEQYRFARRTFEVDQIQGTEEDKIRSGRKTTGNHASR